jgi:hypothetical protein
MHILQKPKLTQSYKHKGKHKLNFFKIAFSICG